MNIERFEKCKSLKLLLKWQKTKIFAFPFFAFLLATRKGCERNERTQKVRSIPRARRRGRSGFGPVASIAGRAGPVEERSGYGRWPSDEKRRRARPVSRDFFLFSLRKRIGRAKFPFRPKTFDSVGMGEKFFFRKKTARGAGNRARPSFRFAEVRNWSKREKGKSSDGGRRGAKGATKAG